MLKKWLKGYIEINKRDIWIIIGFMLVGIVIGAGVYAFADNSVKQLAIENVKEVFNISKSEMYVKTNVIANGIKADALLIGILGILSVTLFGKYIIYGIVIIKGASLSIYTILLFNVFGPLWGIVVFALLVLLVNILYIPALIYLAINFLELHFNIFNARLREANMYTPYRIMLAIFISFIIMFSSVVIEQVASGIVLNIYNKI